MLSVWRSFPVAVRAVLAGIVVAAAGTVPWAVLVSANSQYWSAVPWAVPPTAVYMWIFWRYVQGAGWPRSTAETRRAGGNVLSSVGLFARGRAEWQASSSPEPLIWETGTDASFWMSCLAVLIVGAAAIWAYAALATVARQASEPAVALT